MTIKFIFIVFCLKLFEKTVDAHEIILEKIENAFEDDNEFLTFDGLRVKKFNRTTFVFNGKYDLKSSISDEIDMLVEGFNFQGGQYKKMGGRKFIKFCKSVYDNSIEKTYADFYDASTVKTLFGTCPYPAGKNEVTNLVIEENGLLPPYIPGGEKWRAEFRFMKKDEVLGGFNVYALIRNEQSLMQGG